MTDSRSSQRRIAILKGEKMPEFETDPRTPTRESEPLTVECSCGWSYKGLTKAACFEAAQDHHEDEHGNDEVIKWHPTQ
jgi:hypothetical protein